MMQLATSDEIVGRVALEHVLRKLQPQLEDRDFRGGFHVLSGFTPEQLRAFTVAAKEAGTRAKRIFIKFPASELHGVAIDQEFLYTAGGAVHVRNEVDRTDRIVLTAELEPDAGKSLSDSDATDAADLKDKSSASLWIELVDHLVGCGLVDEDRKKAEALVRGLFDTGRCPTTKVGEFLLNTLTLFRTGEPLLRSAGKSLPVIGLPMHEDCFAGLADAKSVQAAQWRDRFKGHYELECYLYKRLPSQEPMDPEDLTARLDHLRSGDGHPLTDDILEAFQKYVESDNTRNPLTEQLLFNFDWSDVRHCFVKDRRASSKDFADKTRNALIVEGVTLSAEDELTLQSLKDESRKSGSASPLFREFFAKHAQSIESSDGLFLEWEDFVHGKKVICSDLLIGLLDCLQRVTKIREAGREAFLVLEGKHKAPNSFLEVNQKACEFFERQYGALAHHTGNKVRFESTLAPTYSTSVLPHIKDHKRFKGSSRSKKALGLQFQVHIHEVYSQDENRRIGSFGLRWEFPSSSVLQHELRDLDALCRYAEKGGGSLVECGADYEVVGKKGTPAALSLEDTAGFAERGAAGSRGSFVPSQHKIVSLVREWTTILDKANSWLPLQLRSELDALFSAFSTSYTEALQNLRRDAFLMDAVAAVSRTYHDLLNAIVSLKHEETRRGALRAILRVGVAQIDRLGRRPALAVVTPWHPLRMEGAAARRAQGLQTILRLLSPDVPTFSDGRVGSLFFQEIRQVLTHTPYPEVALAWEGTQPTPRVAAQSVGDYTLHLPSKEEVSDGTLSYDDDAATAADSIVREIEEYLRLQPHERDNLSVLLYNCDSPSLPMELVQKLNKINAKRDNDKITCQVLLMHPDDEHLRSIYKDLVIRGSDGSEDSSHTGTSLLSKVRINITAASKLRNDGRSQPIDLAYCRDLISRQAVDEWRNVQREVVQASDLQPHQWSRRLPVAAGDMVVKLQMTCPAQSQSGWSYLRAVATICGKDAQEAWDLGKCPVLMKVLDFGDQKVERIFRETHALGTWVINQDELLDRKLLEARDVKVIRYIQSSTQGRNLIISSNARDTLLTNTLRERIKGLLPSSTDPAHINALCARFMADAGQISGGLLLKAARRANNTSELIGMVLSRYLVESELGTNRPVAWCFLDDFGPWLGKREGSNTADLLVLAPTTRDDGKLHLDVVVTEAKFITHDGLSGAASLSAKQLSDTIVQLTEALDGTSGALDQSIWLARLSDLIITQTDTPRDGTPFDAFTWRRAIRERECSVRIWGYSHVFVHAPRDLDQPVSETKGVRGNKIRSDIQALQEIFGPDLVRTLMQQMSGDRSQDNHTATVSLRRQNGHALLGQFQIQQLQGQSSSRDAVPTSSDAGRVIETPPHQDDRASSIEPQSAPRKEAAALDVAQSSPSDGKGALVKYLTDRARALNHDRKDDAEWLETITNRLRQALISRGLPAKLVDGHPPTLTPNAAIIKLQGSRDLTVQAVDIRSSEIFTSEGIKILNVRPESGRISVFVERPSRQTLYTEPVLLDYLAEYSPEKLGEKLLVGIKEEDGAPLLLDPFNQPHTLVAGMTGSGKSVLVQNLILSVAATRSPAEAKIYLIDPKFGVDYHQLADLPHVRAGSGGIIDEPERAIELLSGLVDEMNHRYMLFREAKVPNVLAYRRATGRSMPTLWIIHDEFADWMQTDEYREAVPDIVGRLSVKARAAGIFLIFAAQRPDKDVMPMQLRSQLGNRLILKVDNSGTSEIAMGEKNAGAERLLKHGHMLAKTGDHPDLVFAQVPYIDVERDGPALVRLISQAYPLEPSETLIAAQ